MIKLGSVCVGLSWKPTLALGSWLWVFVVRNLAFCIGFDGFLGGQPTDFLAVGAHGCDVTVGVTTVDLGGMVP